MEPFTYDVFGCYHLPREVKPSARYPEPSRYDVFERMCLWHRETQAFGRMAILRAIVFPSIHMQRWIGVGERLLWDTYPTTTYGDDGKGRPIGTIVIGETHCAMSYGKECLRRSLDALVKLEWIGVATGEYPVSLHGDGGMESVYYPTDTMFNALCRAEQEWYSQPHLIPTPVLTPTPKPTPAHSNGKKPSASSTPNHKPKVLWIDLQQQLEDGVFGYVPEQPRLGFPPEPSTQFVHDTTAGIKELVDAYAPDSVQVTLSPIAGLILQEILQTSHHHKQWCWLTLRYLLNALGDNIQAVPAPNGLLRQSPLMRATNALHELRELGLVERQRFCVLKPDGTQYRHADEHETYCITELVAQISPDLNPRSA